MKAVHSTAPPMLTGPAIPKRVKGLGFKGFGSRGLGFRISLNVPSVMVCTSCSHCMDDFHDLWLRGDF